MLVRGAGLEPAQYCYRQDLNLVRLPISPPARFGLQRKHYSPRSTVYFTCLAPPFNQAGPIF